MSAMFLVYDTETSGLPDFKAPSDAPHQPHIVEVAAILCDDDGRPVETYHAIVKPTDWTIPDEVADVHGIDTETARRVGLPEEVMLARFSLMWARADFRVAHNDSFDARILRIAFQRFGSYEEADRWKDMRSVCTAQRSAALCALPPTAKMVAAGFNKHKTPKLEEAAKILLGRDHAGAHSALADTSMCRLLYLHLRAGRPKALKAEEAAA